MISAVLAGKNRIYLKDLNSLKARNHTDLYVASEVLDDLKLTDTNLSGLTFANLSLKQAKFSNINFSHCIFINCYLRGAEFRNCNFTGAKFYDTNMRGAQIISSDLSYTQWRETNIDKNSILANLPAHENIAQELLISLRLNANSIGEYDDARTYVYKSEDQSRRYNLRKVKGATDYYKNKYSLDQRIAALIRYLKSHIERLIWGYGEKVMNLFITAFLIVAGFGLMYFLKEQDYFINQSNSNVIAGYAEALKVSLSVFTSFNLSNIDTELRYNLYNWFLGEALIGLIFIGFLAASLHRKISMRRD